MSGPNLVKIKEVSLYVGYTEHAPECYKALKLLKDSGIKYTLLNYSDQEHQHKANFENLSTWNFGPKDSPYQKQFTSYPILIWEECFDDWSTHLHAAHGLKEISESMIFKNKHLIS